MNVLRIARLLGLSSLLTIVGALSSRELPQTPAAQLVNIPLDASSEIVTSPDGRIQVFVELTEPAAALKYAAALSDKSVSKADAKKNAIAAGKAQAAKNHAQHDRVAAGLQKLHAKEIYRAARVLNGISAFVDRADLDRIARLAEVKRVIPIYREYPTSAQSVPFIGAPNVWANTIGLPSGVKGAGVRVGIIDTGIDYMHADFGGTGVLADYQTESTNTAGFTTAGGLFPTAKVVGGIDLVGDAYGTTSVIPAPDPNPMDCNGHGSHVAGTAAGLGVDASGNTFAGPYDANATTYLPLRIVPGVAPDALLYAIRVFGCGGSTGVTVQAIDWAMDPNGDDDLSDHLDVINMSLGSNYGTAINASSLAADNASLAGVIVAMSAGNSGDSFFINGSPGVATRGIATAASLDGSEPDPIVTVNSPAGIAGNYFAGGASFGAVLTPTGVTGNVVIGLDPADGAGPSTTDGCSALTNAAAVAGNIALIDRGTCGFIVKVKNAQNAGAIAVIIADNGPGSPPPGLGGSDPTITIPSVRVTLADGNTFKTNIASLNVSLVGPAGGDTLASFSSRGPRHIYGSALRVKPDIAAPGLNITSVQTGHTCTTAAQGCTGVVDPSGFDAGSQALIISGTSMASPHIAGVMALLRQLKPDWSVEELKALAMNYALNDVTEFPSAGLPRYPASRVGAGRVDPAKAAVGEVVAMNADDTGLVSVTFDPEIVGIVNQVKKVRVINKSASQQTFDLAFDDVLAAPGVAFSLPGGNQVVVPAGGVAELDVQMSADSTLTDHTRDPSLFATQGVQANYGDQPRNYLTEKSSYLTFSQSSTVKFRLPVYMAEKPASSMSAADTIVTGGNPTGSTTVALSGNDLCTGTLAAGPTCTGTFPNDVESLVSPFELQVVNPLNPTVPAFANIHYVGTSFLETNPGSPSINTGLVMFGIASWGDWATPNDVSYAVCVDNNNDGVYDRIVYNTNPSVFVANASPNDNYVRVIQNTGTGGYSILGLGSLVNVFGPDVVDSALQANNVMILGATQAQLGIVSTATTSVKYKVVTCSGVGCARTTTGDKCSPTAGNFLDQAAGPFTYNWGAQGLNFGGDLLDEDLNGKTLPVAWNTANLTANGSVGGLLLHHQNKAGTRAEVVVLDTATHADLAVTQSVAPPTPAINGNVIFTVTVTNNGPNDATGVVINESLPSGVNYVSDDSGGSYNSSSGQWAIGALNNGASTTLNVTATVLVSDQQCAVAQRADSSPLDTNPANDSATVCALAPHSANLKAAMSSPATVLVGAPLTYTITVTNQGSDPAYSLSVQDEFPSFLLLRPTSFVASQGIYDQVTGLWNVASLDVGKSATLAISLAAPNMAGALTEQATASASTSDPDTADNTASSSTTVLSPSAVSGTMTVAGTFSVGNNVTYTVTLANSANYDQQDNTGHEFTVVLPPQLALISANAGSGTATATIGTNTVDWDGVVAAHGDVTITITAKILDNFAETTAISAQGTINYDADGNGTNEASALTDDPTLVGASDPTVFNALQPAAVTATKTVAGTFLPSGTVTYTVTLSNAGPGFQGDYAGHEFVDLLPSAVTLTGALATSGTATISGNTVNWDGSIAVGGSVTITITATVNAGTYGQTVSNQGIVFFDADGNGSNESNALTDDPGFGGASDPTTFNVPTTGGITATASASPNSGIAGTASTFTVTVTSGTNPPSTGVTVTADLTDFGGTATQAFTDNGGGSFTFSATVQNSAAPGLHVIPVSIADAQGRTANASIAFNVPAPGALSGSGLAEPGSVGLASDVTLLVSVIPGTSPDSSGLTVTANLAQIGGDPAQTFYDDGTHGDQTAGDHVYTFVATVPSNIALGTKLLPVTIGDAQARSGSATIQVNVVQGSEVIFANGFE